MKKQQILKITQFFLFPLLLAIYMQSQQGQLEDGIYVQRNEAGEGEKEIFLTLEAEGVLKDYSYELEIPETLFTKEEAESLMQETIGEIQKDFQNIREVIPARKKYQNGLVEATWKYDVPKCMDMQGNIIQQQIPPEGQVVNTEVTLQCQNYEIIYGFSFFIPKCEMTESELLLSDISTYIEEELKKEGQSKITLPSQINGIPLIWKETKENTVAMVILLEIVVVILWFLSKAEKKKEAERIKKESLESDYPKMVEQMTILLGAGMTISQAIGRMVTQYTNKIQLGILSKSPAFEELMYIHRRMQEGESEREALMVMEQRIPLMSYRRLIHILLNNKSKGGDYLCRELEQEAQRAYNQKIYSIKQKGEEASTKMLAPLMLMMLIVIAIVILPAWIELAG